VETDKTVITGWMYPSCMIQSC